VNIKAWSKLSPSLLLLLAACMVASACATLGANTDGASVSYLDTVRQNYEAGEKALSTKSYDEAISYFEHVRSKYPYSKYAALSDLRLADTYFAQEKWLEAADGYDFYIRFHPRHEKNAYAWFQVAKSYYLAIPTDFFLIPKSYVKDQTATKEALEAVERYLSEYPNHEGNDEAKQMKKELRSKLAMRDMYVARFYEQRRKWRGAMTRYDRVASMYPDTDVAPEALYASAQIAEKHLEQNDTARTLLGRIIDEHAGTKFAKDAELTLVRVEKKTGDAQSEEPTAN
jgi:outer membrane protein assembly factor BamD